MRIAVAASFISGVEYYRLVVPYMALAARGHDVVFVNRIITAENAAKWAKDGVDAEPGVLLAPHRNGVEIVRPDVLVLSRTESPEWIDTLPAVRARGTAIIYDLDDNHHAITPKNPFFRKVVEASPRVDHIVRVADVLTCSTQAIADEYGPMRAGPTVVIPNRLDPEQYRKYRRLPSSNVAMPGQVRIGWAGSPTHVHDLHMVRDALLDVAHERPEVHIVLIGPTLETIEGQQIAAMFESRLGKSRVETIRGAWADPSTAALSVGDERGHNVVLESYRIIDRAGLDIAIAPLESTTFNRGRSYVKALEYAMLGIPTVASDFGPYREFVRWASPIYGKPLLLAEGNRAWRAALRSLVRDGHQRERLAQAAQHELEFHPHLAPGVDVEDMLRKLPTYTKPFVAL